MIQLVTQFDRPGVLPGAAPQSCGACCCCCCCCCVVSTLAASVVTARSVGRPFVPDAGEHRVAEAPQPGATVGAAAGAPRANRGAQATTRHKIFAALLMPASAVLGVYAVYVMQLPGAGLLGPGAWLLGLAWLSRRGLPRSTAVAVFVLGLLGFVAEAIIYYRIIISS